MNKKAQAVAAAVTASIVFIIGAVLFVVVQGTIDTTTTPGGTIETGLSFNNTVNITLANIPVTRVVSFSNGAADLVVTTNYTIDAPIGLISPGTLLANGTGNTYNISYQFAGSGFATGTSRSIITVLPALFLVVLIVGGLAIMGLRSQ